MNHIRHYLQNNPPMYDLTRNIWRGLKKPSNPTWHFLNNFSKIKKRKVNFVQIGANDGIKNDPIRGFIIRDKWNGILVEPLPNVFDELKQNYSHLKKSDLIFVNAAISSNTTSGLDFWTFSELFLKDLSQDAQKSWLRKSSFDKNHLKKHLKKYYSNKDKSSKQEDFFEKITIPCLSINDLITTYWKDKIVDLLVIDAEGHESEIINSINFDWFYPDAIFFESAHLKDKKEIYQLLRHKNYDIIDLGMDSVATRINII
ncbi:methyltransferase FkbM family [Cyanobacterium stanieri PCC 7202]|uniref:Methyltransferase FkbM family n=1 Tax=Cyanobacterium stanieri (strain ATCC 29140 / PCC 7202) TaxID=292563 RepID=K9YMX5_CYASC|nr:methyltransferase FkbM family [Cyanobacterium stanieri PCC 7202]